MKITSILAASMALATSGCGYFFGEQEQTLPSHTIEQGADPFSARANYMAGSPDYRFLSTGQVMSLTQAPISVTDAVVESRYDGMIIRGFARAGALDYSRPVLVRDPEAFERDPENLVYFLRLTGPVGQPALGNAINRDVHFAGFMTDKETAGARSITLVAAQNSVTLRLR